MLAYKPGPASRLLPGRRPHRRQVYEDGDDGDHLRPRTKKPSGRSARISLPPLPRQRAGTTGPVPARPWVTDVEIIPENRPDSSPASRPPIFCSYPQTSPGGAGRRERIYRCSVFRPSSIGDQFSAVKSQIQRSPTLNRPHIQIRSGELENPFIEDQIVRS